ncbi:unnamed protein product [Vitrella brassicaformis CCMP3155]|uniref:Secreted protein n=1 Tax=Vitrella brassicaformis (strain CCMP3155) TaxID=1169540 RepID=A0A0G4EM43_VITBC|nr:unnamed protein product [Vitrella brassicaformis CCMP3155]|eukprot:CEL98515.1 unnamed protein product [Vitrella brassicaformis CCMP3155]
MVVRGVVASLGVLVAAFILTRDLCAASHMGQPQPSSLQMAAVSPCSEKGGSDKPTEAPRGKNEALSRTEGHAYDDDEDEEDAPPPPPCIPLPNPGIRHEPLPDGEVWCGDLELPPLREQ